MRMAHKIISTLLALQLLVSFGLCGGLCCLASINTWAKASAAKVEVRKSEEPAAAMSHCPLHARKAAEAKSQHLKMAAIPTASTTKQETKAGAALQKTVQKTVRNTACCLHPGSAPKAELSQALTTLQTHRHFAVLQYAPWRESLIEQSPSPSPPKPDLASSPPHAGFQLSLRI